MTDGDEPTPLGFVDFFDMAAETAVGDIDGVAPLFACATADEEGCGSVAITEDAVYLGEEDGVHRIEAVDIRVWSSAGHGRIFSLTIEGDEEHVTRLFSRYRAATVAAMTKVIGPERTLLRAA